METRIDEWCYLDCRQCRHYKCNAEMADVESTCKRLDHKKIQFAKPWFKSYDCNSGMICRDFYPADYCKWLVDHWTNFDDLVIMPKMEAKMGLVINGDQSVRYYVKAADFIDNTFIDEDGEIKWIEKAYYKQSRKSSIGYELIRESNPNIKHM